VISGIRAQLKHALDWRMQTLLDRMAQRFDALDGRLAGIDGRLEALDRRLDAFDGRLLGLQHRIDAIVREDAGNRRRLHAARRAPGYDAAFLDADPLVSILIPTHDRPQLLVERAVASALAQEGARVEVVVVGDAAPPEVEAAVRAIGDPRVRWANTTHRVVDADPDQHWLVASTLPRNLAYQLARGAWFVDLDDDDALRPDAVARLLAHAREHRLEVAYGQLLAHVPDRPEWPIGVFPPRAGEFAWQGAIVHAGLGFFERELVAAKLGLAGDVYRIDRMLRAGARIGFLEAIVCDYWPSTVWGRRSAQRDEDGVADAVDVGGVQGLVEREGEQ
jgi:NAD(P)-dependent dehydrogenase (short-subunit alcohol dehydrogenase family)